MLPVLFICAAVPFEYIPMDLSPERFMTPDDTTFPDIFSL